MYKRQCLKNNLDIFYENFFNEKPHKEAKEFLDKLKTLSTEIILDYQNDTFITDDNILLNGKDLSMNIIYTIMRFIHFVKSKRD